MSNKVSDLAWQQTLRTTTKFVLIALSDHADKDGWCWPGKPLLAKKCGLTERAVQKALVELEDQGLIEVQERFRKDGSQKSNGYYVLPLHFRSKNPEDADVGAASATHEEERRSPGREQSSSQGDRHSGVTESHASPTGAASSPMNPQRNPQVQPPPQPRESASRASPRPTAAATVSSQLEESEVFVLSGLVIPDVIGPENSTVAKRIIASLPHDQQQDVLDELSGRCRASQVKNALGYLRALAREMKAGTFTPDFASQVRSDREARARNLQAYEARLAGQPTANPAPPSAETRAKIQALIGRLAKPPAT